MPAKPKTQPTKTSLPLKLTDQLDKLGYDSLREARDYIEGLMKKSLSAKKKELREQVAKMAKDAGLAVEDLVPQKRSPKSAAPSKPKAEPTHKNPANPSQTWAGRGRKPKWLADMLKGKSKIEQDKILAKFEI
jgi:DNA-binding protein H-NS